MRCCRCFWRPWSLMLRWMLLLVTLVEHHLRELRKHCSQRLWWRQRRATSIAIGSPALAGSSQRLCQRLLHPTGSARPDLSPSQQLLWTSTWSCLQVQMGWYLCPSRQQ